MPKMTQDQVKLLADRYAPALADMGCDQGITPRDYLVQIFSSQAFAELSALMMNVRGMYQENIGQVMTNVVSPAVVDAAELIHDDKGNIRKENLT